MRLTDNEIKRLPVPERDDRVVFDDAVKGFAVRIRPTGGRVFVLMYRRKSDGKQRRMTIGAFGAWNTTQAREEAKRLKREIDGGADPVGDQQESRDAPTVADLAERFIADYLPRKRPSTQKVYGQQIRAEILPALGTVKVAAVSHADVDAWHHRLNRRAPVQADRTLAVLSRMFSLGMRWGWRPDNPCRGVERNPERKRTRYLTGAELARLSAALAELRDKSAANAIRLLLLTGARQGELLAAQWDDIDLEAAVWVKPGATTKTRTEHRMPLSAPACQLLAAMQEQAESKYLFPGRRAGHRPHINAGWIEARATAELSDVRLHDLRHTFATLCASSGHSLPVIGALLGHTTPMMTQRYSHLTEHPLRGAAERVGAILTGKTPAEILSFRKRRR